MKSTKYVLPALLLALASLQNASAQNTRAEVKSEAAAAVKSGTTVKGEGPAQTTDFKPTKKRADVKTEAIAAVKAGAAEKEASAGADKGAKSTKARADVKKEAAAAVKAGQVGKGPDVKN